MPRRDLRPAAVPVPPDDELMARVARAEKEALRSLYDRFAHRVYASAIKHTSDGAVAEDVVQEVFLAVWVGAGGYRPERGSPEQWLFAITRNKIQDHWRRMGRLSSALGEADAAADEAAPAFRDSLDERRLAQRAMAVLTAEQKELVSLVYLKDLRFQEAARVLGLPLGTVKSRIHAALQAMRGALEGST